MSVDGCLSHKTAVAVGALTQYLRFILLSRVVGINATEYLRGTNYLMNSSLLIESNDSKQLTVTADIDRTELKLVNDELEYDDSKVIVSDHQVVKNGEQDVNEDDVAEIELEDDISQHHAGHHYEHQEQKAVLKDRPRERGVHIEYRKNNILLDSQPSLYYIIMSAVSIFVLFVALRMSRRCKYCHCCRCK